MNDYHPDYDDDEAEARARDDDDAQAHSAQEEYVSNWQTALDVRRSFYWWNTVPELLSVPAERTITEMIEHRARFQVLVRAELSKMARLIDEAKAAQGWAL